MTISLGGKKKKKGKTKRKMKKNAGQHKTPDDGKNIGKQYLEQTHSYIQS